MVGVGWGRSEKGGQIGDKHKIKGLIRRGIIQMTPTDSSWGQNDEFKQVGHGWPLPSLDALLPLGLLLQTLPALICHPSPERGLPNTSHTALSCLAKSLGHFLLRRDLQEDSKMAA